MSSTTRLYGLACALVTLITSHLAAQHLPAYRIEQDVIPGDAELLTIVQQQEGVKDVPLISVLRDTLGHRDPENDRLRYVWILTTTRPSLTQRVASAMPFACFRFSKKGNSGVVPKPVLDLAAPSKNVWTGLLSDGIQVLRLDPMGALVRTTTRSYRGNLRDYRRAQIARALRALEDLMREPERERSLSDLELRKIYSRLLLADRMLGGLVREEELQHFYDHQAYRREQIRGQNWELLRQRAELCGLYFDPIKDQDGESREALLWVSRRDLEKLGNHTYTGQFLGISNPWTDDRLLHWTGYSTIWHFDVDKHVVDPGTAGAHTEEMIPLALYNLEYPRVPLLLVDFRDDFKPKRRELAAHGTTALVGGLLGITAFSNWSFFAAGTVWNFVRSRHGATLDHNARIEAYSETTELIHANGALEPGLKAELLRRLDHLALNPLESAIEVEEPLAREQHRNLLAYAVSPTGLSAELNRDHQKELTDYRRSAGARLLIALGRFFTRGPRADSENEEILRAQIDAHRRIAYHIQFLSGLLAASPRPEVICNVEKIRESIQALEGEMGADRDAARIIARVLTRTEDVGLRLACLEALRNSRSEQARNELKRLADDPGTSETVRLLCKGSLGDETGQVVAGAGGAQ